jgi:hypothetical protein
MTWITEENGWKKLPKDEKYFVYELGLSAIGATAIVLLLGQ